MKVHISVLGAKVDEKYVDGLVNFFIHQLCFM